MKEHKWVIGRTERGIRKGRDLENQTNDRDKGQKRRKKSQAKNRRLYADHIRRKIGGLVGLETQSEGQKGSAGRNPKSTTLQGWHRSNMAERCKKKRYSTID